MSWLFPRSRNAQPSCLWRAEVCLFLAWQAVTVGATTFYVDSAEGKDSNRGTLRRSAWRTLGKVNATVFRAGDRILFKAGCSWAGQLEPQGMGKAGAPIRIDRYDAGPKPIINGGGVRAAITLNNPQYLEIQNLEVLNSSARRVPGRSGIRINAGQDQACVHVYLRNCTVQQIHGPERPGSAGILATGSAGWFSDLRIENCVVREVDGEGIVARGSHQNRKSVILVRNNMVSLCGGSGIRISHCGPGSMDAYNVVLETCSALMEDADTSGANQCRAPTARWWSSTNLIATVGLREKWDKGSASVRTRRGPWCITITATRIPVLSWLKEPILRV